MHSFHLGGRRPVCALRWLLVADCERRPGLAQVPYEVSIEETEQTEQIGPALVSLQVDQVESTGSLIH